MFLKKIHKKNTFFNCDKKNQKKTKKKQNGNAGTMCVTEENEDRIQNLLIRNLKKNIRYLTSKII